MITMNILCICVAIMWTLACVADGRAAPAFASLGIVFVLVVSLVVQHYERKEQ